MSRALSPATFIVLCIYVPAMLYRNACNLEPDGLMDDVTRHEMR